METKKCVSGESICLDSGDTMQVTPLADGIYRIRVRGNDRFEASKMERYGIIKSDWKGSEYEVSSIEEKVSIKSGTTSLQIDKRDGSLQLLDASGYAIIKDIRPLASAEGIGVGARFELRPDEKLYGLGYRRSEHIQLRGQVIRNHLAYGECYGPNPYLMSSNGWGMYYNTTFDSYYDLGHLHPDQLLVWCKKGELDLYLMTGDYAELLNKFTGITGRPTIMPKWGYGLMFIANEKETQFDLLQDARTFRQEGIPCDMIGLEPGWMSQHYDLSTNKDWNSERFYMPWWSEDRKQFKDVNFIGALQRNGFQLSLWLSCDYDVFEEEERQAKLRHPKIGADTELENPFGFGVLDFDPRAHKPIYLDKVTQKGEPWFQHLKRFIDSGVRAFKQDPAYVVNEHPDRLYANGMVDEEAHNLYTTVLAKQMYLGYKEYTGERPMHFMGTAYTGIQRWAPTWTCDCGGREPALMGMLLHSLCGHMNITCDMDVHSTEGIHFGFLQPWSQVNSWAFIDHPWWLGESLFKTFVDYAKLHYRLIPYLYSYAHQGHRTGMPILRAMPLMYPKDAEADNLTRQYMLGEWLIVGAFTSEIYLPAGGWIDYWTGECYEGKQTISYVPPSGKGGPLFVRKGAIIPMTAGQLKHTIACSDELIELHIYPDQTESRFTLFEDDGISFGFEMGEVAWTEISCRQEGNGILLSIGERQGSYRLMPAVRKYEVVLHSVGKCKEINVLLNGKEMDTTLMEDANHCIRLINHVTEGIEI